MLRKLKIDSERVKGKLFKLEPQIGELCYFLDEVIGGG